MNEKKRAASDLSAHEINLIERLRRQPKIMERVERILEVAHRSEGPLQTADEIEKRLLEEMRCLGNATMNEWATHAEDRVGQELKTQNPAVLKRKKKR